METQRVEAARKRRIEETERRQLQLRTARSQRVQAERKILARFAAKELFQGFKRSVYGVLESQGALRNPIAYQTQSSFVPRMLSQVQSDLLHERDTHGHLDQTLSNTMRGMVKENKEAIMREYKRREDKKREEFRIQKEKEEEKKRRKEERAAARERARVNALREKINDGIVTQAKLENFSSALKIYDVRDPNAQNDGLILIGGLMGEFIITFTCLFDYILANP